MAYIKNFEKSETKHQRMVQAPKSNYDPEDNATVKPVKSSQKDFFREHIEQYHDFISWARWFPDLFLDLIKPETGGINLHFDQRVFLRCICRFYSVYGVFPRGWSKTWSEVASMFIIAILYPGITMSLTAQTKANAAELLKDKYDEITRQFPLLKNEMYKPRVSKDDFELNFVNGSRIDVLANAQTSKGQRRNRIQIEESALIDADTFDDALKPIVEIGRTTKGKLGINDPLELNQQINFFTTAG